MVRKYGVTKSFTLSVSACLVLTACVPSIRTADYGYSYISATETYVSTQRFVGELYLLRRGPNGYTLEALDQEISVEAGDMRKNASIDVVSSKVSGASVEVINTSKGTISGSAVFEAKVDSIRAQVRKMSGAKVSSKIEELYGNLWTEEQGTSTLKASEVLSGNAYYVVVSGAGLADKLELSHGSPDGTENGFTISVNGFDISGVKIRNNRFFKESLKNLVL